MTDSSFCRPKNPIIQNPQPPPHPLKAINISRSLKAGLLKKKLKASFLWRIGGDDVGITAEIELRNFSIVVWALLKCRRTGVAPSFIQANKWVLHFAGVSRVSPFNQ